MKPLTFHPAAEAEANANAAFEYYWTKSPNAAFGFDEELRESFRTLRRHALTCPPYLHGTRRVILEGYPFSVVFRERLQDVQIIAIAHAKLI